MSHPQSVHTLIPAVERKIRCDMRLPKCNNCTKSKRVCQGYGMQLSWPRNGDRKRAIVLRDTQCAADTCHTSVKKFLHSSTWDISLSEELEHGNTPGENQSLAFCHPVSY